MVFCWNDESGFGVVVVVIVIISVVFLFEGDRRNADVVMTICSLRQSHAVVANANKNTTIGTLGDNEDDGRLVLQEIIIFQSLVLLVLHLLSAFWSSS